MKSANIDNISLIGNNFQNDMEKIGNDAVAKGKEILDAKKAAVKEKIGQIKTKGLCVWNFLKKTGVMLGTALGTFAGLVAAGTVAVTLPVSLPVLGAVAGGLFIGGGIAALVGNIKDPNVKGASNVIIQTLKNIGSGMLMAIPTLIAFLLDPKQIGECIQSLKNTFEDAKKDIDELKKIALDTVDKFQDEAKTQFENLQNEVEKYKEQLDTLTKNSAQGAINALEISRTSILEIIGNLENNEDLPSNFKEKLESLKEKFDNNQLNKTFQKLNESFSGEPKKTDNTLDDTLDLSDIKIEKEIEGGELGKSTANIFKDLEKIENNENSKNTSADRSVSIQKKGDYIPPKVDPKPIQKNNVNNSIHRIFDAYDKVNWSKIPQNKLSASAVQNVRERMEILKKSINNDEVLREHYTAVLALVQGLCNCNSGDKNLTELKDALENFKIPSPLSVAVNEDIKDSVLSNSYHAFGEQLIGSAI